MRDALRGPWAQPNISPMHSGEVLVARRAPTLLTQTISRPAIRREVDVMGLTVCLALLGALIAGSDHEPHSKFDPIVIVRATTVGLVLTHAFALMLAVWLVKDPTYTIKPAQLLGFQLAMAALIAFTATVVAMLWRQGRAGGPAGGGRATCDSPTRGAASRRTSPGLTSRVTS